MKEVNKTWYVAIHVNM